jgi:hypothetical protein
MWRLVRRPAAASASLCERRAATAASVGIAEMHRCAQKLFCLLCGTSCGLCVFLSGLRLALSGHDWPSTYVVAFAVDHAISAGRLTLSGLSKLGDGPFAPNANSLIMLARLYGPGRRVPGFPSAVAAIKSSCSVVPPVCASSPTSNVAWPVPPVCDRSRQAGIDRCL